jgi:hypothetical protein
MRVTSLSAASAPSVFLHSNRVTGVLAGRHELDALTPALESLGVAEVEVLEGTTGAGYLDKQKDSFRAFLEIFFGGLEAETRQRYAQEIEQGRLVFAVPVTGANKDDVVAAVKAHGASHVVHFGMWMHQSFGQL